MAIMAAGSSMYGGMQQRSAIKAANRAQEMAFTQNVQATKQGFADEMGQLAQRTTQELEAAEQQSRKVQANLADFIGKQYSGAASVTGNALLGMAQGAFAKKGEADAAINRNKDMIEGRYYQEGGVRAQKAWSTMMGAYRPPASVPGFDSLLINAATAGFSAYATAKQAGMGETTKTDGTVIP
tara:strand:+ start:10091 stop:10639 length:549 start_codon:yes stop_codon:yes gene_type:complete